MLNPLDGLLDELKNEGIEVSVEDVAAEELTEILASKCNRCSRCASCSNCSHVDIFDEIDADKIAA
jgi:hypothetical protein